ncbi:MAG TPA: prepilin-type N-terminal cleavage/methylation domain-containing protein [Gemmatimonadaceae bacterium]
MAAARANRPGFTLWELSMVLLVMAIAATLAAPAFARFGAEQPSRGSDQLLGLLHDARKAAFDFNATVTLRVDPKTLKYQVDTTSPSGAGTLAEGVIELGFTEKLDTDARRLQYVFRPTGAAFADTVVVRGGNVPLVVRVDPWSGVARADTL